MTVSAIVPLLLDLMYTGIAHQSLEASAQLYGKLNEFAKHIENFDLKKKKTLTIIIRNPIQVNRRKEDTGQSVVTSSNILLKINIKQLKKIKL